MPYIEDYKNRRANLMPISKTFPETGADLAFQVWCLIKKYFKYNGMKYTNFAIVAGVLILTLLEMCRRYVFDYEAKKQLENKDVQIHD